MTPDDDFASHGHIMSISIQQAVRELVDLLGLTLVATIGGVSETRAVTQWMTDREPQKPHALRFALQLATMIATSRGPLAAKAWFMGSNPHLGDRAPVLVLRSESLETAQNSLMAACRRFIATRNPNSNS